MEGGLNTEFWKITRLREIHITHLIETKIKYSYETVLCFDSNLTITHKTILRTTDELPCQNDNPHAIQNNQYEAQDILIVSE